MLQIKKYKTINSTMLFDVSDVLALSAVNLPFSYTWLTIVLLAGTNNATINTSTIDRAKEIMGRIRPNHLLSFFDKKICKNTNPISMQAPNANIIKPLPRYRHEVASFSFYK